MSNLSVANNDTLLDAIHPAPARLAPFKPADIVERIGINAASHEIADADMIGDALQVLADRGQPLTIYPPGGDAVLARILSVHPDEPHFTLELGEGSTLPPGRCTFVTWLDAARFQFELTADWAPAPDQPLHIPAQFPPTAIVLNRRTTMRLETPLTGNYTASFVLFGNPHELQLYDISAGGIGMRCAPRDANGLHIGRKLQRVRLELGESIVICDLEIRLARRFRSFLLGEQVQIGCRFVNLSPQMQNEVDKAIGRMAMARR
ncbi:flagellar brake protein [Pseudoduganella lurida]|nr:PilZ domain-containing protein [Pseudoduganella lurida]